MFHIFQTFSVWLCREQLPLSHHGTKSNFLLVPHWIVSKFYNLYHDPHRSSLHYWIHIRIDKQAQLLYHPSVQYWEQTKQENKLKVVDNIQKNFIEYLTQNIIFHVKSHVTKHEFLWLLIQKSQCFVLPNLTRNETWYDTSLKKLGNGLISCCELNQLLVCLLLSTEYKTGMDDRNFRWL